MRDGLGGKNDPQRADVAGRYDLARMDRPANLMMIVAVWLLEGPVALDKVEKPIAEGLLSYRRYRQKVEYTTAGVFWRDDPNFDMSRITANSR